MLSKNTLRKSQSAELVVQGRKEGREGSVNQRHMLSYKNSFPGVHFSKGAYHKTGLECFAKMYHFLAKLDFKTCFASDHSKSQSQHKL